jgi:hypothetical protein
VRVRLSWGGFAFSQSDATIGAIRTVPTTHVMAASSDVRGGKITDETERAAQSSVIMRATRSVLGAALASERRRAVRNPCKPIRLNWVGISLW